MGFFSKVFKGVKKVFKKIGKGIKKVVKGIGKAVGKLGIVGQIGMMFILPGVGGALAKGFGAATSGLLGSTSAIARGIGHVLATAGKFASTVGNVFRGVTDAIGGFIKNVGGKVLEKVGLKAATEGTVTEAFQKWMNGTVENFGKVLDPWKQSNINYAQSLVTPTAAKASMTAEEKSIAETNANASLLEPIEVTAKARGVDKSILSSGLDPELLASVNDEIDGNFWGKINDYGGELMTDLKTHVKELPKEFIKQGITTAIMGPEEYEDPMGQVSPVWSQAQYADQSYAMAGYNYGSTPVNQASFMTNYQGYQYQPPVLQGIRA